MMWRGVFRELTLRSVSRELAIALIMAILFSALFILGSLVIHQELPRWK